MKRLNFQYSVAANVLLAKAEIKQVMAVGQRHYDAKCRQFAAEHGSGATLAYWLFGWDDAEETHEIMIESRELDTICKILEQEARVPGVQLYSKFIDILREVRDERERVNAHWMILDTETYTAQYRDDLKAKYGDGKAVIPADHP